MQNRQTATSCGNSIADNMVMTGWQMPQLCSRNALADVPTRRQWYDFEILGVRCTWEGGCNDQLSLGARRRTRYELQQFPRLGPVITFDNDRQFDASPPPRRDLARAIPQRTGGWVVPAFHGKAGNYAQARALQQQIVQLHRGGHPQSPTVTHSHPLRIALRPNSRQPWSRSSAKRQAQL